jgi:predicted DNA-binding protein (UPF0251 family)
MPEGECIDCGNPTGGLRCKPCHGAFLRQESLRATEQSDAELLAMVDGESLSYQRLADRLGVSKQAASQRVKGARRRTEERKEWKS